MPDLPLPKISDLAALSLALEALREKLHRDIAPQGNLYVQYGVQKYMPDAVAMRKTEAAILRLVELKKSASRKQVEVKDDSAKRSAG